MEESAGCSVTIDEGALEDPVELIHRLEAGDIFHASSRIGASFVLLVIEADQKQISARRVTTQDALVFDRSSGRALEPEEAVGNVWIDCVEPLPFHHHNAFVMLDRRYRLGRRWERFRLTDDEKAALLYIADHRAEHGFDDFASGKRTK